ERAGNHRRAAQAKARGVAPGEGEGGRSGEDQVADDRRGIARSRWNGGRLAECSSLSPPGLGACASARLAGRLRAQSRPLHEGRTETMSVAVFADTFHFLALLNSSDAAPVRYRSVVCRRARVRD